MKITKTYLKQLIREELQLESAQNTDPYNLKKIAAARAAGPLPGVRSRGADLHGLADEGAVNLYNDINAWFKSLIAKGGPLEGLDLEQAIQDYPILKKAAEIQKNRLDDEGNLKRFPLGDSSDVSFFAMDAREFEKIKKEASLTQDPATTKGRDARIRQDTGQLTKIEKAAAQGFPKQDPEKQRGR